MQVLNIILRIMLIISKNIRKINSIFFSEGLTKEQKKNNYFCSLLTFFIKILK